MTRLAAFSAAVLVAILAAPWLTAQEAPRWVRTTTLKGGNFPPNLVFLVDRSGSMGQDNKYAIAVAETMRLAEQATDEMRLRFFVFANDLDAEAHGWIQVPDPEAMALAKGWLRSQSEGGGTQLAAALVGVLELPEESLGVILVSDMGDDDPDLAEVAAKVEAAQAKRKSPAVLGFVTVQGDEAHAELAKALATKSGGAATRLDVKAGCGK